MVVIGIIGEKIKMTQIVGVVGKNKNKLVPVTAIFVEKNVISQVKQETKENYQSCQLAFKDCSSKSLNKPLLGHLKKNNITAKKYLFEIRGMEGIPGSLVDFSKFRIGERIKIIAVSKGKGFSGVIKRYHYRLGAMSHGSGSHRQIGSMCSGRGDNQKVAKNKGMPGRMGGQSATKMSVIEKIDLERNIIFMRGPVPGPTKGVVVLRQVIAN